MQNSLQPGQYVLVNKIAYLFHAPERGDIIILQEPDQPSSDLIKRVIGLPGDAIKLDGTNVWVNGTELNEPYITQKSNPSATTLTVPPDKYFAMGDNRPQSKDSRSFGFVPKNYIVGKSDLIYSPLQ